MSYRRTRVPDPSVRRAHRAPPDRCAEVDVLGQPAVGDDAADLLGGALPPRRWPVRDLVGRRRRADGRCSGCRHRRLCGSRGGAGGGLARLARLRRPAARWRPRGPGTAPGRATCHHPSCNYRNRLPAHRCRQCGETHYAIRAGRLGAFIRRCGCGAQLPTTVLGAAAQMVAVCQRCDRPLLAGPRAHRHRRPGVRAGVGGQDSPGLRRKGHVEPAHEGDRRGPSADGD